MKYKSLILFGPPGAGKGTWGKVLDGIPGFFHLSSGDMFRGLNPASKIGSRCMSYINKGQLVPDDVTINLWKEHMVHLTDTGQFNPEEHLLLLDGIPRNLAQARELDQYLEVMLVMELSSRDREALIRRLRRRALIEHRQDDASEETIRHRFDVYDGQTHEMLGHYRDDVKVTIDVSRPVIEILYQIARVLMELVGPENVSFTV